MSFGHPYAFWLLALVAVGAVIDNVKRDQKQLACPRIPRLRAHATSIEFPTQTEKRPLRWLLWAACALLVGALAGPRLGFVREAAEKGSREVVLAIDLSRSMLARDVKPSRLDHAKLLAAAMINKAAGDRFGLVLFSASAYLQLPLSNDYDILAEMLPNLSPDYFPVSGTNYEAMLKSALTAFGATTDAERFLVVLSDGEAFDKGWKNVLPELKQRNIHVIGLGIGTPGGGLIPDGNRAVRDANGLEILTRLEPATMQELAAATGGAYQRADTYVDIGPLLKAAANTTADAAADKVDSTRLVERYRWALVPALLLLALSFWLDFPVHPSLRVVNLPQTKTTPKRTRQPMAAAAAALFFVALLCVPRIHSQDLGDEEKGADYKEADTGSPMQMHAKLVSQRIAGMLKNDKTNANDCVSLVIDIVAYCEQMLRAHLRFPVSIVDDGRKAIEWGEKLDPQGGDWIMLRKNLDTLLAADIEPWKTTKPDGAGKVAMKPGYEEGTEMKNDRRASRNGPVEDVTSASDLALPLLKLEQVRRQDQPARLFLMLEGKKNNQLPPSTLPQW